MSLWWVAGIRVRRRRAVVSACTQKYYKVRIAFSKESTPTSVAKNVFIDSTAIGGRIMISNVI